MMLLAASGGCNEIRNAWNETEKYYTKHLSPTEEVDYEAGEESPGVQRLAHLFMPVDMRLEVLSRVLETRDTQPDSVWLERLRARFPWISGTVVMDNEGQVIFSDSADSQRPFNPEQPAAVADGWKDRAVRLFAEQVPGGTELYLGVPYFDEDSWQGITLVRFDISEVVTFSPAPGELAVLLPEFPLWKGDFAETSGLLELDWADLISDDVSGDIETEAGEFLWKARYLGGRYVIYIVAA